jgi:predicted nucleic acid-binding protein
VRIVLDTNILLSAILTEGTSYQVVMTIVRHPELELVLSGRIMQE